MAQVHFDIPAFAGTVRVMAVAWSKDKVGKAAGDVVVRDPVVLTATLPRFLRTGDTGAVQLELDNVEGAAGDYAVAVGAEGAVTLGSPTSRSSLKLAAKQRDRISRAGHRERRRGEHAERERERAERLCAVAQLTRSTCAQRRKSSRAAPCARWPRARR